MKLMAIVMSFAALSCVATPVKMPSKEVLEARLDAIGLRHFAQVSWLVRTLANEPREAVIVAIEINRAFADYSMPIKDHNFVAELERRKPLVIKAFLQDYPVQLKELKKLYLYESNRPFRYWTGIQK